MRLDGSCHEAFYARGLLREAQGYVFAAVPEFQKAVERSQPGTAARERYASAVERCTVLIASGAALEMQKVAEASGLALPEVKPATGERREAGKTSRRRRKKGGDKGEGAPAEAEGAAAEGGDAAAEEAVADAGSDDAGSEASSEDAASEASSDDAPVAEQE